ncbi:hypothetical protein [Nostoc sp. DedQUE09]|uniref:hypothetical protein n=1 Tax=Nostoc sp. DedQUE09 TaxID=3075394 RepID=UPI002AD398EB|nr:hypothetical protein [Nostoc sp. DedQUE09]
MYSRTISVIASLGRPFYPLSYRQKGLYLFFLPPYFSEMNRMKDEWYQLKNHEIAGQTFDNNYDLAIAIIDGIEARSVKGGYALEFLIFNCA